MSSGGQVRGKYSKLSLVVNLDAPEHPLAQCLLSRPERHPLAGRPNAAKDGPQLALQKASEREAQSRALGIPTVVRACATIPGSSGPQPPHSARPLEPQAQHPLV
jgi:hypothetical protein